MREEGALGTIPSGGATLPDAPGVMAAATAAYGWTGARLSLVFGDLGPYRCDEPLFSHFALGGR
jgi:hypothetical protein